MSRGRHGLRRRAVAVVALLAGLAAAAAPAGAAVAGPAAAGAAARTAAGPVVADVAEDDAASPVPTLRLRTLSPTVAHPGDDLELVVQVDNPTEAGLDDATLEVAVAWQPIFSRSTLAAWVDGTGARPPRAQLQEPLDSVTPGGRQDVTLTLPVDELGLGARGPFRMAILLRDDGEVVAQLRTFLLWDPSSADDDAAADDDAPVRLSLLASLTGPPVDPADPLDTRRLAGVTAPGEPLTRVLAAVADAEQATGTRGALALAVDPALVATAATSGNAQVAAWADRVAQVGDATDVYPLPPYDPDLAALARAGLTAPALHAATTTPLPDGWTVPATWGDPLVWPAGPAAPDLATLGAARAAGLGTAVLTAGLNPTFGTATGLTTVATEHGDVAALLADQPISQALADATDVAPGTRSALSTAEAVQRLLAETSVVSAQGSGAEPHLLAVLPRGWAPDVDALRAALEALSTSGWVRVAPLPALLSADEPTTERRPLDASAPQEGEVPPDEVRRLDAARTSLDDLATVAADPAELVAPLAQALAAPTSIAWRDTPDTRPAAVTAAVDAVTATRGSITVTAPDALLISAAGDLPVLVSNALSTDVTVTVVLRPDTPRLVVDATPTTVVRAHDQARVNVPVRALGSGDVEVVVEVLTPTGDPVATPITLQLRVRAGWETAGTAAAAGVVGLLFVLGIWRTVRRGRSARRTVDAAVPDPVIHGDAGRS